MATLPATTTNEGGGCCLQCLDGTDATSSSFKAKRRKLLVSTKNDNPNDNNNDDATLAKELNELSFQERERILEEIHGVADEMEETPELINSCLEEMDTCLSKLSRSKRRDYDRAVFLKPSIPNDKQFKILFLRCDNYNAQKAAERMAKYFTCQKELFGLEKMVKKITLEDLDDKDLEVAKSGGAALRISQPDRSGRPVMFIDISKSTFHNYKSVNRYSFHNLMTMLEHDTAQKKGMVMIIYCPARDFVVGRPPTPTEVLHTLQETVILTTGLPFRISSFHFCYGNPMTQFFIAAIRSVFSKDIRLRLRTHFGSATEIRYLLRSFGIQVDGILVARDEVDEKPVVWQHYIDSRQQVETREQEQIAREEARTGIVAYPTQNDVLLGRGRPYPEFPGNQRLNMLVDAELKRYRACMHLFEKIQVLQDVQKTVQEYGGSFLKRVDGGWEKLNDEMTIEKIRKAFQSRPSPGSSKTNGLTSPRHDNGVGGAKRFKTDPRLEPSQPATTTTTPA